MKSLTAILLLLAACSMTQVPPVIAQQSQDPIGIIADAFQKDLVSADNNLRAAIANGSLPATDPAAQCFDAAVANFPATNTQYQNKGIFSVGSIIYIQLNAIQSKGPLTQQSCQALIGKFALDGMKAMSPIKLP